MTNTREDNFNKARGLRLKRFRIEILDINQKDFAELRGISQSKMSMIERGQMPDEDLIQYYSAENINWNWAINNKGPMLLPSDFNTVNENIESYHSIKSFMAYMDSTEPIDVFFKEIERLREDLFFRIKTATDLSDEERADLYKSIADKIFTKAKLLKQSY